MGSKFPIVGIGASAGGIEALEGFFKGMPADPGLAFVIVTHLNPERESILHEVVRRYTTLPVRIAADDEAVVADTVYVLPSDAVLGIENGRLSVSKLPAGRRERHPIDIFLSALAKDLGEYSASVILSGGDGDGTLGTKAVKERGGITLAQVHNGHGPSHPDMPESAISTGFVDLAIPAELMGDKLVEFGRGLKLLEDIAFESDSKLRDDGFEKAHADICSIILNQVGHDFSGYKTKTFFRRVQRRMQVLQFETVEAYLEQLRRDAKEVNALFRDLLITVTNFFRDGDAFEKLAELVIPKLFEGRGANDVIRIWVPGCATGEEVYSIAILIREHMDGLTAIPKVQIFATDIDERALSLARAGRYPEALLDTVSNTRRERFFIRDSGTYVLSKDVRDLCIFSAHSILRDPPFSRIDLVSCRNLLIYFGSDAQAQVVPTFHYSLRAGGYLFLGTSENIGQFSELFIPLEKKHRIFRGREDVPSGVRVPLVVGLGNPLGRLHASGQKAALGKVALRQAVETQVLERFAPAHVVTNREGDVVFYSARTGKYLEQAVGIPSRQLLTMARKGLRLDLRAVFREAVEKHQPVTRGNVPVDGDDGRVQMITVTVEPLIDRSDSEPLYLVLFSDDGPSLTKEDAMNRATSPDSGTAAHLDQELRETRERLQSLIEEYETALEELKSSNEELVSVNEELQSTNEELEASKEELQSLNEELHTVNAELNGKIEALDQANSDLQNLFDSTEIATVFLDSKLTIRSFTPAVSRIFSILPSDRGRPITDLASRVSLPGFIEDLSTVLAGGNMIERRIEQEDAAHLLLRISPYRNSSTGQLDGIVVTFIDVTLVTVAEMRQRVLIAELNHRVKNMLTIAIGLAHQTLKTAPTMEDFKESFISRLHAMARSYELVARDNWTKAAIQELIEMELSPFGLERVSTQGPPVDLKPSQALSFGMVLHELATNAAKYGALSTPGGRVFLSWSVTDEEHSRCEFVWSERGGPEVKKPKRRGFGVKLIENEVRYNLGGTSRVEFERDGLSVRIGLNLEGVPEE